MAFAEAVRIYQRPRVKYVKVESTKIERGLAGGEQHARRIVFKVKGSAVGTATSIQLRSGPDPDQGTFAKWDKTPEPREWNSITRAWENRNSIVPATFYLPLYENEEKTVPIVLDYETAKGRVLDVFCGWWYIENTPKPYRLRLASDDVISVEIQGMPWESDSS